NASVRTLFDEAIGFGCISEKNPDQNTSARFQCHFTKEINLPELYAKYEVDPKQIEKASLGNLKQVLRLLKDMFSGGIESYGVSDIFGSTNLELAKENFIRSPKLIEKVKLEVGKYQLIEEKIAEIEQFIELQKVKEVSLNQFIQAVYTKTIRKRGALYVYDKEIEEDAWAPFVNLMKTTKFVDFEIYQAFKSLNAKQMAQLEKKSERRSTDLINQEQATELISALEEMAATYQKEKEALDYDYKDFANGEELYIFYKEMMIKVQDMLRQLKS
ncbi:MAG: hypothetical protein ACJ8MO_09210, partial [Bacillus sp. (in: firmicutes)]